MSHLPHIPLSRANKSPSPVPSVSTSPIDALKSIAQEPSMPAEAKVKLQRVIQELQGSPRKVFDIHANTSSAPRPLAVTSSTDTQRALEEIFSGHAPQLHALHKDARSQIRVENFKITSSRLTCSSASPRALFKRSSLALQNPFETFEAMNRAMYQTLRYEPAVEHMEFDIMDVREHDGSVMQDHERLFLSVCCSIFANFSLCSTLNLDLSKLVRFLADLFNYYSDDNTFHNALHAADSLQMLSLFFREQTVSVFFTDLEILISLLSVLTLDVAHPGMMNQSLAEINHPLVTVFGDMLTTEVASLMVFTHELFHEDHFFLDPLVPLECMQRNRSVLREGLYDVVTATASRRRAALLSELQHIAASRCVNNDDVPHLMAALVVLSSNAMTLRPQKQFLCISGWFLTEMLREAEEMNRRQLPYPISGEDAKRDWILFVMDYCRFCVKPLADAVNGLIPTDLYDNLERNADPSRSLEYKSSDMTSPVQEPPLPWIDKTGVVVEILKKATTHAKSLDRKASKRAILNASPRRPSIPCLDRRACSTYNNGGVMPLSGVTPSSSACGHLNLGVSVMELDSPSSTLQLPQSGHTDNRSEHYFSFLRLYDSFEREGRLAEEFCGQLVFLALQLEPQYIGAYARRAYGENCTAKQCSEMAAHIMATEEAPSTAEAIASRFAYRPSSACSASEESHNTDGYLLLLMDMYLKREESMNKVIEAQRELDASVQGQGGDSEVHHARTGNPSSESSVDTMPPNGSDTLSGEAALFPTTGTWKNSPIRLPLNTDSSAIQWPQQRGTR